MKTDVYLLHFFQWVFYFMLCCFRENLLTPHHKSGGKMHSCLVRRFPILLILPSFFPAFFHLFFSFHPHFISFISSFLLFCDIHCWIEGFPFLMVVCEFSSWTGRYIYSMLFCLWSSYFSFFFLVNYIDRLVNAETINLYLE